jgi:hypothetical protein
MPLPSFPVYGLTDAYAGLRWMNVWNRLWSPDGPLWMVVLGHGDPDSAEHIGLATDAKLAKHPTAYGAVGPTGVDDVRRMAWLEMVTMATPASERDSAELQQVFEAASSDSPTSFATSDALIKVNGLDTPFLLATYGGAWAACADLGESAVGIFGARIAPEDVDLQTINARLDDYELIR